MSKKNVSYLFRKACHFVRQCPSWLGTISQTVGCIKRTTWREEAGPLPGGSGSRGSENRHSAAEALLDLSISDVAQDDVVAQPSEPVEVGGDLPGPNATAATSVSTSDTTSLLETTANECQRLLTENSILKHCSDFDYIRTDVSVSVWKTVTWYVKCSDAWQVDSHPVSIIFHDCIILLCVWYM